MHEDDLHQQSAFLPSPRDPSRRFSVVLLTIYSIENAGIRYVSAALQREGIDTTIVFLRDWVQATEDRLARLERLAVEQQLGLGRSSMVREIGDNQT